MLGSFELMMKSVVMSHIERLLFSMLIKEVSKVWTSVHSQNNVITVRARNYIRSMVLPPAERLGCLRMLGTQTNFTGVNLNILAFT